MIRENTLLARAFGATLNDVVQAIGVCAVCGTGKLTIACETTGDILDNSSDRPAHRPGPRTPAPGAIASGSHRPASFLIPRLSDRIPVKR